MYPEPKIKRPSQQLLVGKKIEMTTLNTYPKELWQSVMPYKRQITGLTSLDNYAVHCYQDLNYFKHFDPKAKFTKWAAFPVSEDFYAPEGFETFILPNSLYAVFTYRGHPGKASSFFNYIYNEWLPSSSYELADRPHFAVMGERYNNFSDDSEEEIWVPIDIL